MLLPKNSHCVPFTGLYSSNVRTDSESVNIDCNVVNANMEPVVKELIVVDEESHSNEPTNNSEKTLGTHIYQLMKD